MVWAVAAAKLTWALRQSRISTAVGGMLLNDSGDEDGLFGCKREKSEVKRVVRLLDNKHVRELFCSPSHQCLFGS